MLHSSIPRIPFTREAYEKMQADILPLEAEREAVMGRLKIAREMGDLSENGAYKYAKFELGNINRELRRLKHLLEYGEIVESKGTGKVEFGSTVELELNGKKMTYVLVSQHESDPFKGKISYQSPLGKALVGRCAGEKVSVNLPGGVALYSILSVS